jgi:hypothetical protein
MGFSTSRTMNHLTSDDRPVASRVADWSEVRAIVNAMGDAGGGIFELASEEPGRSPRRQRDYFDRLKNLAVESGCPITFGMPSIRVAPELWPNYYELANETAAAGGRMFVQTHSRSISTLLSFKSHTPFDHWEGWKDVRSRPLEEQKQLLRDPSIKRRLVEEALRLFFEVREVPDPKLPPAAVLIEVRAAGVNPVDWKVMGGGLDALLPTQFPVIPGWDVAGVVVAVGMDTPEFAVGDEVTLFGDPTLGVPSAADWAEAAGTIGYELMCALAQRVPVRVVDAA